MSNHTNDGGQEQRAAAQCQNRREINVHANAAKQEELQKRRAAEELQKSWRREEQPKSCRREEQPKSCRREIGKGINPVHCHPKIVLVFLMFENNSC